MSSPVASETPPSTSSAMLRRTVAVVDMVGYSSIAKILEENISAASVADLNHQIQAFMTAALAQLPDPHRFSVVARTGDGIILLFEAAADAHLFGYHVHLLASRHNESRAEGTAMRRFRVGIATGEVNATASSNSPAEYAGITIANAVRLEAAAHAGEIVMDAASFAALAPDLQSHYGPETSVKGKREESFRVRRFQVTEQPRLHAPSLHPRLTRRSVLVSGAALAAGTALAGYLEGPSLRDWMWARSHPLPQKRFVALMGWLTPKDPQITPAIGSVLTAIENELTRAEAFDNNLLILPYSSSGNTSSANDLSRIRDSLGATLVLVASAVTHSGLLHLKLRVMESPSSPTLREKTLRVPADQLLTLPDKAVHVAAHMLEVVKFSPSQRRSTPGTTSPEAFNAFQSAEHNFREPNDQGLQAAIEQYRRAIEIDSKYADAYAGLAYAYTRLNAVHPDSGALNLAEQNAQTAISLDRSCVVAHMAVATVHVQQGDFDNALAEMRVALAVDPMYAPTLTWQGQLYARLNHWKEAEDAFKRSIHQRPNRWGVHNELGALYYDEGKYSMALREFQTARLADRKSTLPVTNIACIYLNLGNTEEALAECKKSLAIEPSAFAATTMATILRSQKLVPQAKAFAKQATELDPDSSTTWLELGDCCSLSPQKGTEAAVAYRRALQVQSARNAEDPHNGPGLMLAALYKVKCTPSADIASAIEHADAMFAGDIDSQLFKVRALELSHNRGQAIETLRQCIARGVTHFQVESMPDSTSIVQDSEFKSMFKMA